MRAVSAIPRMSLFCHHQTRSFHILFMHHGLYFPTCILTLYFPCFSFFLINQSQSKASNANQMIHLCFSKRSTVGQLNAQAATAEKEK